MQQPKQNSATKPRGSLHPSAWFPLWWTLANGLGGAAIGVLEAGQFQFMATLVLTGVVLGVIQGWMLRRFVSSRLWLLVSSVGWLLGIFLMLSLSSIADALVRLLGQIGGWEVLWLNVLNQPITLTIFSLCQWIVLRQRAHRAAQWVPVSVLAGVVEGAIGAAVCAAVCQTIATRLNGETATAVSYGLGWAGYGVVTGFWLARCLIDRHSPPRKG